jgi:hypothetical protein
MCEVLGIIDGLMDDCIEAQWRLYIGFMRKTIDYNITIIILTIIPLTPPSNAMGCI